MKNVPHFPIRVHPRKVVFFFFMYLFSYVLHRQQPANASVNMNNKNNEELHNEGLSGVFWYVPKKLWLGDVDNFCLQVLSFRHINGLPSRWWCYFNYSALCSPWSRQAALNDDGKSHCRILQLLELHLQVISSSFMVFLLVVIKVTDVYVKLNITTIVLMKMLVTWGNAPSHRQEYFFEGSLFLKFQSSTSCSLALVWQCNCLLMGLPGSSAASME